jgi:hypothetical protein
MQRNDDTLRRQNPFTCGSRPTAPEQPSLAAKVEAGGDPRPSRDFAAEVELLESRPARLLDSELRTMSGYEEQQVEEFLHRRPETSSNTAALCNELLARCLVAAGRDPGSARTRIDELSVSERDLALLALRRRSYGDLVETLVDCPVCGEVNETRFDLAEMPLELGPIATRLRVRVCEPAVGDAAPLRLLGEAELRLPSAGDQAALLAAKLESSAQRRSWMLARVLLRLDCSEAPAGHASGGEGPFTATQVHELPVALRRGLERGLEQALPQLSLSLDVRCHACAHEFVSPFEVESFFLPS